MQFDYNNLGKSRTGENYVLMVRDNHSGYCWFNPAQTTDEDAGANALLDAPLAHPKSSCLTAILNFKNETMRLLTKGPRTLHHFTLPYWCWSNGAIERLEKELIRVARALISKL